MRTREDALRSLKRYLAQFFGEAWDLRLNSEDGTTERPVIIIEPVGGMLSSQHTVWKVEYTQPVVVYGYPEVNDDAGESQRAAWDLERTLSGAFNVGGHGGRPRRVPLYDYDGLKMDEPSEEQTGFMKIGDAGGSARSFNTHGSTITEDADDARLYTVVFNLRLNWLAPGEVQEFDPVKETKVGHRDVS